MKLKRIKSVLRESGYVPMSLCGCRGAVAHHRQQSIAGGL